MVWDLALDSIELCLIEIGCTRIGGPEVHNSGYNFRNRCFLESTRKWIFNNSDQIRRGVKIFGRDEGGPGGTRRVPPIVQGRAPIAQSNCRRNTLQLYVYLCGYCAQELDPNEMQ